MGGAQEEAGAGRTYLYITGGKFGDHMSDDIGGGKYPTAQTLRIPLDGDGEWEAVGNLSTGERTLSAMANLDGTLYHAGGRSLFYPLEYVERYGFTRMGVCCSLDGCVYVCELHACVRACVRACMHASMHASVCTCTHAHTYACLTRKQSRYDGTRAQWTRKTYKTANTHTHKTHKAATKQVRRHPSAMGRRVQHDRCAPRAGAVRTAW